MLYTVDASFKAKNGRELSYAMPLWKGEAADTREALEAAHTALSARLPFPEGTDVIVLSIKGADGSSASASEYAEDFEVGYGASAIGSTGLLGDGIEVNLTDEQREAAERLMQDRAIDALPDDIKRRMAEKQHADAVDSLFDGFDDGGTPRRTTATTVGGESEDDGFRETIKRVADRQDARHGVSAGPGCDKTFNDCRHKFKNADRFGGNLATRPIGKCPHVLGDSQCGASLPGSCGHGSHGQGGKPGVPAGAVDGHGRRGAAGVSHGVGSAGGNVGHPPGVRQGGVVQAPQGSWTHQAVNPDPIGAIHEAAHEMEKQTGLAPNKVRVTRAQYNRLVQECRKSGLAPHNVTDVRSIHGLDIEVVDGDPYMPSIQVERPSRYATGGLTQIFDEVNMTDIQRKIYEELLNAPGPFIRAGRSYGHPTWLTPPEVVFPRSDEYKRRVLGVFPDDDAKEAN